MTVAPAPGDLPTPGGPLSAAPLPVGDLPEGALLISIALAVASAGAYALGAVLQQRLAAGPAPLLRLMTRRGWWYSVALNGTGGLLHVGALAYGPLSVVQPLGVLTLVLALPIGAFLVGRRVAATHWRGALATVAGLVVLLLLIAPASGGESLGTGGAWTVVAVATASVVALCVLAGGTARPAVRAVLYATASGVSFAVASALTQTVTRRFTEDGPAGLLSPLSVALAAMATAGLLLSQVAYRGSGLGAPLAVVTLSNPVASAVIGVTMLGEGSVAGMAGALVALAAAALAAHGVVLLSRPDPAPVALPSDPAPAASPSHPAPAALPPDPVPAAAGGPARPGGVTGPATIVAQVAAGPVAAEAVEAAGPAGG
ncbi:DMT family transporter [Polymorphospora rubra]|uniref:DMT family transporter n=1 Tax=Polymorphospora rubra TaxID=338584 RepID=UPI0033DE8494